MTHGPPAASRGYYQAGVVLERTGGAGGKRREDQAVSSSPAGVNGGVNYELEILLGKEGGRKEGKILRRWNKGRCLFVGG